MDHLFDFYWGGPERRITSLTLKIISVNAIALIMLLFGILYLGQYQNNIIETKLQNFDREVQILSLILAELDINQEDTTDKIQRMINAQNQQLKVFDNQGRLIIDQSSHIQTTTNKRSLKSVQMLKDTASFIVGLLPDTKKISPYPEYTDQEPWLIPDLSEALSGGRSLSAWEGKNGEILLSAGAPIQHNDSTTGAVVLLRQGDEIKAAIGQAWKDILKIFTAILFITIVLSIYLAGSIANPLKKLADAAEDVRTGRAKGDEIPDLSDRYDEIGDLSVVLRSMTDALWEKMDSIESFAADVAHELKNPLTSLKSAVETLHKVTKQSDKEKLLGIINHDIERMDRLITDISAASRLDSELSKENFVPVNLGTTLTELLETYKDPIERGETTTQNIIKTPNGPTIELHHEPSINYTILGSGNRLKHVLRNLIDNAISFSTKNDTIHVTLNRNDNAIIIHVEDEGPGIPANKLETVFNRFYTERPEHAYGQNSGLGLSICKQIIESHRGGIYAENISEKSGEIVGARFSVILKAA